MAPGRDRCLQQWPVCGADRSAGPASFVRLLSDFCGGKRPSLQTSPPSRLPVPVHFNCSSNPRQVTTRLLLSLRARVLWRASISAIFCHSSWSPRARVVVLWNASATVSQLISSRQMFYPPVRVSGGRGPPKVPFYDGEGGEKSVPA